MWHSPTQWPEQQRAPEPEFTPPPRAPRWWRAAGVVALAVMGACGVGAVSRLGADAGLAPTGVELTAAGAEDSARQARLAEARLAAARDEARRAAAAMRRAWAGDTAAEAAPAAGGGLAALPFVPFHQKRGEYLRGTRLGYWPAERRPVGDPAYANPRGFYIVTPASYHQPVSRHFTLGEFAMKDGRARAGESYVVLQPALLDKLERVVAELRGRGVPGADLRVLSGFRAPSYNSGVEGAAESSRHQFGDAVDVVVDGDGDGRMDDLNRDGRVDRADLYLFADAVERVERQVAALVGGLGMYDAQGPSGPFLHIDVRGRASRWGTALRGPARPAPTPWWARTAAAPAPRRTAEAPPAVRRKGCKAEGDMAALCATQKELLRGGAE